MLKNYFKIAWRNITRNRFHSIVNILGLSTGISFVLLTGAFIWQEFQVNKSLKNLDQQYIIQSEWKDPNQGFPTATLGPLAKALKDNYPDLVANYYRFDGITSNVSKDNKSFRENLQIGDSTMLEMFGFGLLYGNPQTALKNPFTVVITKNEALKYFGKTDVVGQTISIESFSGSKHDFIITGVLKPLTVNSVTNLIANYPGDFYVSSDNLKFFGRNMNWQNPFIASYIQLKKGISPKDLEQPIAYLEKQNASPQIAADLTTVLTPLKEFYLTANKGLVKKMIYTVSAIALFILAMAIINFINMSVSRSVERMREIGIRKVLGGLKTHLVAQFLTESIVVVSLATACAFVIYNLTRNLFSIILGREIPSLSNFPVYFISFPFLFILLTGFVAGIYPALLLSSLKSAESLKGKLPVKDKVLLRKTLIIFQFGIATVAFISAIIISKQIDLFLNKDLGYNKDFVLSAQVPRDWSRQGVDKIENIRDQFAAMPQLNNVSVSYEVPDGNNSGSVPVYPFGSDSTRTIAAQALTTDENYLKVYKIPLKAGSFFEGHALDSGKIILNETAAQTLGWKNETDAVGQQMSVSNDPTIFTVKGIVKDFHFGSKQQKISPVVFFNVQFAPIYRYLSFKTQEGNPETTVSAIESKWRTLMPGTPFEYKFMDDRLSMVYKTEIQLKRAAYTATVLGLIIVLLGVLGLISLSIQKRTKEIGIRKILGSSVSSIIHLFMKEFLIVIAIATVIACPIAYYMMQHWLNDYAYRITITAYPFIISILILGLLTILLIVVQTIKAALTNPVKSLRAQ